MKKRYLKDKPAETDKDELFDSIAKWQLARDSNNKELAEIAMNNVIGHMSTENKDHYLKFRRMLGEYIKSKDDYDYKTGKYSTTEYSSAVADKAVKKIQQKLNEKGYTDKYGNKLKEDGRVMYDYAVELFDDPGNYSLFGRQCDYIVAEIFRIGGIEIDTKLRPNDTYDGLDAHKWKRKEEYEK